MAQVCIGREVESPGGRVLRLEAGVDGQIRTGARVERHRVAVRKRRGVPSEHAGHAGGLAHVPGAYVLVEIAASIEHMHKASDLASLPRAQGLVEGACAVKHLAHAGDAGDVPSIEVLIKAGLPMKQATHVRDGTDVPGRHQAMRCLCCRLVVMPLG